MRDSDEKKEYEIAFLAKSEEAAKDLIGVIKAQGAEIVSESPVNKINLAYKIKKETSAYFGYAQFSALPENIKLMDDVLKNKGEILRYLIITPPYMKNKPRSIPPYRRSSKPVSEAKPQATMPLSNEALEKKIEEILNK